MKAKLKEDIRRIQTGAKVVGSSVTVYRVLGSDRFEDLVTGERVGRGTAGGVRSNFFLIEKFLE